MTIVEFSSEKIPCYPQAGKSHRAAALFSRIAWHILQQHAREMWRHFGEIQGDDCVFMSWNHESLNIFCEISGKLEKPPRICAHLP
jgi:hypothetical protein